MELFHTAMLSLSIENNALQRECKLCLPVGNTSHNLQAKPALRLADAYGASLSYLIARNKLPQYNSLPVFVSIHSCLISSCFTEKYCLADAAKSASSIFGE
jgi:hypothetical protein